MSNRQLARDMEVEFRARLSAKQARRDAEKAKKVDKVLQKQIQELLVKNDVAHATQKAKLLLTKQAMAAQMDQAADMAELSLAQIQANNAQNKMMTMMGQSARTMAFAQRSMNTERTLMITEQFRQQNEEYSKSVAISRNALATTTSMQVSDEAVNELLGKLADDAGVTLNRELNKTSVSTEDPVKEPVEPPAEAEDALQQRLRALRE